jgi:multidrug efflux pump subunit AcrA (membrane-fusion protein)
VTSSNSQPQRGVGSSGLDLQHLKNSLAEIFTGHQSVSDLYRNLTKFIISLTGAGVVAIGPCRGMNAAEDVTCITDKGKGWGADILKTLQQGGQRALDHRQVAVARYAAQEGVFLIAVPVEKSGSREEAICVAIETSLQSPDFHIVVLQLLAQCLSLYNRVGEEKNLSVFPTDEQSFSEIHSAVAAALCSGDKKQAGPVFVQKIKEYFQADVVMLAPGLQSVGGQSILHSSVSGFSESAPQMKLIKQVVAECRQQERMLTWKLEPQLPETLQSLLLRDMTVALFAGQSICFPLRDQSGAVIGALIVCWHEPRKDLFLKIRPFLKAEKLTAGLVSWIGQSMYRKKLAQSFLTTRKRFLLCAVLILGILFAGWLPVPFTVSGKCVLEPRQTRFVVAQFDAVLKKVHKLPGDTVSEGELLAEFDERSIQLEISSLLADIQKSRKMQDIHTAKGKAALAQMAVLERRGLEEQLQLFRDRLSKLSIQSPVDGIVISENMERVEGSPISRGQGIFEIAPLKTMIAEAYIAQEDIGYVQKNADTTITLESFPDKSWQSTVYTIFPRADQREGKTVFLVESLLENTGKNLRPGMRGEFEIVAGKKPLAWKLFRRPWIYFQKTFLNG